MALQDLIGFIKQRLKQNTFLENLICRIVCLKKSNGFLS